MASADKIALVTGAGTGIGKHAALVEGLRNGTLRPVVGVEIPLKDAPRSHEAVMEAGHHGKVVLVP